MKIEVQSNGYTGKDVTKKVSREDGVDVTWSVQTHGIFKKERELTITASKDGQSYTTKPAPISLAKVKISFKELFVNLVRRDKIIVVCTAFFA